jgi:hypothetical protein
MLVYCIKEALLLNSNTFAVDQTELLEYIRRYTELEQRLGFRV